MSHPTPTRRPIPAVPLVAVFFAAMLLLTALAATAPLAGFLLAIVIAVVLTVAYLRGWSIR